MEAIQYMSQMISPPKVLNRIFKYGRSHFKISAHRFEVFVIHNHLLAERKVYLVKNFDISHCIHFVEIEKQAPELLDQFYAGINRECWTLKCESLYKPAPEPRVLSRAEIACTASHFYAYKEFLRCSNKEWLLVIEDDAIFKSGLEGGIQKQLNALPAWADALFIGGGFPHDQISRTLGKYKNFIIKQHPATNTTVAYLLRRTLVERIIKRFHTFDLPIDYELAYLLMINNALVLHADPYLISEGSKFAYQSSIRSD